MGLKVYKSINNNKFENVFFACIPETNSFQEKLYSLNFDPFSFL